jgi:ABC-2 type transport system permease protein
MIKLLQYDFLYLKRSFLFVVFPVVAIIFALLSPLTAKYINEILELAMSTSGGNPISLPDPTVMDSYVQYMSNLFEILLFVIVFVSVSFFMKDKNKGQLQLILSKPVSRIYYLLSKYISLCITILVSVLIGALVFVYGTYILFDEIDIVLTLNLSLLYMVYVLFILSVALFFSQYLNGYASASIATFVSYLAFSILGNFDRFILDFLPGRIMIRMTELMLDIVEPPTFVITLVVSLFLSFLLVGTSIFKFKKYDL